MKRHYKKAIFWIVVTIECALVFSVIVMRWSKSARFGPGFRRPVVASIRDADGGL
jgi:hypothetical protein